MIVKRSLQSETRGGLDEFVCAAAEDIKIDITSRGPRREPDILLSKSRRVFHSERDLISRHAAGGEVHSHFPICRGLVDCIRSATCLQALCSIKTDRTELFQSHGNVVTAAFPDIHSVIRDTEFHFRILPYDFSRFRSQDNLVFPSYFARRFSGKTCLLALKRKRRQNMIK